jgi:hypothetical protein
MEITDMAKGSSDYTGGHLNVGNLNLGDTSKLSMTIASGLITEKNASTGELDLITASGDVDGDFARIGGQEPYKGQDDYGDVLFHSATTLTRLSHLLSMLFPRAACSLT